MSKETKTYSKLLDEISKIWVIDTHEHLMSEADRVKMKVDPLSVFFTHYASTDLVSAGLSPKDLEFTRNPNISVRERWKVLKPYWDDIKYTSYGRVLRIAMKDLYEVDDLHDDTIEILTSRMCETNRV